MQAESGYTVILLSCLSRDYCRLDIYYVWYYKKKSPTLVGVSRSIVDIEVLEILSFLLLLLLLSSLSIFFRIISLM